MKLSMFKKVEKIKITLLPKKARQEEAWIFPLMNELCVVL